MSTTEVVEGHPASRSFTVPTAVYSLDTVKKSAYRFIDRFALDVQVRSEEFLLTLTFVRGMTETAIDSAVADFKRELLDQDLRERIARETAPLRNTILALAFAQTTNKPRE